MVGAAVTAEDTRRFRTAIEKQLGLQFDDGKTGQLGEVLGRRLEAGGRSAAAYLSELELGPLSIVERRALARDLTVGETFFFRNIGQFEALREIALPVRARARQTERRLSLLSAGCASGEEAYSMAIVARELGELSGYQVSIRGVDVNAVALGRAALGRYSTWAFREAPDEVRDRHFRADGRELVLDDELRRAVAFEERNLLDRDPVFWRSESFDVVFCRNVIMYFAPEIARAVVGRLTQSLVPGGFLFLGYAETLRGLSQEFHLRHTHGTFYYQRREPAEGVRPVAVELDGAIALPALAGSQSPVLGRRGDEWIGEIGRASARIETLTSAAPDGEPSRAAAPEIARARPPAHAEDVDRIVELLRQERFAEAQSALAGLLPEAARDPDVLLLRAVLLTHGGDLAAAERLCGEVLAVDELSAGAHYLTALCRERAGDEAGAAEHDQVAAHLEPGFAMPRFHLGLLARRAGDVGAARRELEQALALLERDDAARLSLYGGGFGREGLISLCRAELRACGGAR